MASLLKRTLKKMNNKLKQLIAENSAIVENELEGYVSIKDDYGLVDTMAYSLLAGGKRIRPFIVLETYKAFSGLEDVSKALPFACALEMIHTYSLIHDDLPSMDNDDYRRGKLTNHKVYGEGPALLAGDTLLTYAFEILASNDNVSAKSIALATKCLASCAGAFGMAGGQMIDLNSESNIKSYEQLKKMHALKTGALMKCAVLLGYYAFTDEPSSYIESQLESFAINLGIAFQVRDDVLDVIASDEALGKPTGSDSKNGKITTLTFMSLDDAKKEVDVLTNKALEALEACLKEKGKVLCELAKYMVERDK